MKPYNLSKIIDEVIEISDPDRWETKNLKIIQSLKKEFGFCECSNKKLRHGMMTPSHYRSCIKYSQCVHCEAYFFNQNYILELLGVLRSAFLSKEMEKGVRDSLTSLKKHDLKTYL